MAGGRSKKKPARGSAAGPIDPAAILSRYATTSIIKPKPPPVPEPEPEPEPVETQAQPEPDAAATAAESAAKDAQERMAAALRDIRRAETLVENAFARANETRQSILDAKDIPSISLSPASETELVAFLSENASSTAPKSTVAVAPSNSNIDGDPCNELSLHRTYEWLHSSGLPPEDIETAMRETGGASIELALEWICIHIPLDRLPSILSDKLEDVQKVEEVRNHITLLTLSDEKDHQVEKKDRSVEPLIPDAWRASAIHADGKDDDDDAERIAREQAKSWILNRAFDDDDEDEMEEDGLGQKIGHASGDSNGVHKSMGKVDPLNRGRLESQPAQKKKRQQQKSRHAPETKPAIPAHRRNAAESPDTASKVERRIDDDDDDFNESESWEKVSDIHVEPVLSDGVDESHSHQDLSTDNDTDALDEETGDIMGAMFDDTAAVAVAAVAETTTFVQPPKDMSHPSWTGATPMDILQQWIKKNCKGATFVFHPLKASLGFRSGLRFKNTHGHIDLENRKFEMDPDETVTSKEDAKHYVSTKALFELAPDQPHIRNVLPPKYSDLFKGWTTARTELEHSLLIEAKRRQIDFVMQLAEAARERRQSADRSNSNSRVGWNASRASETTSSQTESDSLAPTSAIEASKQGEILRTQLLSRTNSRRYQQLKRTREALPVYQHRESVLKSLIQHPVVVLSGETGSGKSTQIPQFLLEHAIMMGEGASTNVVCTQPRRISAVSLAERVSQEMGDTKSPGSHGTWVGYQVRLENRTSSSTRLTYCTTGVILRRIESDPLLSDVTHIIVDEVHERSLDSDFLIFLLRRLLVQRPGLRIVLMSATANADFFAKYFETGTGIRTVPCLQVPGKTHPVTIGYLEEAIMQSDYRLDPSSEYMIRKPSMPKMSKQITVSGPGGTRYNQVVTWDASINGAAVEPDDMYYGESDDEGGDEKRRIDASKGQGYTKIEKHTEIVARSIANMDPRKINYDLIEHLVWHIIENEYQQQQGTIVDANSIDTGAPTSTGGSILVFLPGFAEIRRLADILDTPRQNGSKERLWVVCLHSALDNQSQSLVFRPAPAGVRKVVLSTNIAETGITIPDVVYVIDTCRAREVHFDNRLQMQRLADVLVSRANCRQRAGRAGRVRPGQCFHLIPRETYEGLPAARPPEMVRLELEEVCLRARAVLGPIVASGPLKTLLVEMPSPPPADHVERSISLLHMVEALDDDENLTRLGNVLVHLPLNVRLGKMLVYALFFGCLDPVLTICAALSLGKSPFMRPDSKDAAQAAAVHAAAFRRGNSDLLAIASAFEQWRAKAHGTRGSAGSKTAAREFCSKYFLSEASLDLIHEAREQLRRTLVSSGLAGAATLPIAPSKYTAAASATAMRRENALVEAVFAAALYPNLLVLDPPAINDIISTNPSIQLNSAARGGLQSLHMPGKPDRVMLHHTSLLHTVSLTGPKWFTYHAIKADTAKLALDGASNNTGKHSQGRATVIDLNETSGVAIALLCGRHATSKLLHGSLSLDDGHVFVKCVPRTCSALVLLRRRLGSALDAFLVPAQQKPSRIQQDQDNSTVGLNLDRFNPILDIAKKLIVAASSSG